MKPTNMANKFVSRRCACDTGRSLPRKRVTRDPGMSTLAPTLNEAEKRQRVECEEIIRHGWDTFVEVGQALSSIRGKRLYRDRYGTFEGYCRRKWELSKSHAYRMIESAAVASVLSPIGVKLTSESQARPLAGLAPQSIPAAWKRAQELAGMGEVTASVVRRAAEEFKHETEHFKQVPTPQRHCSTSASLELALKLTEQVEAGTKAQDMQVVVEALKNLRKCLLALQNG